MALSVILFTLLFAINQGTQHDAVLQHFYDSLKQKCIGQFYDVNRLIGNKNIFQASFLNNSIVTTCLIEANHKTFNQIYLATLALGIKQLSSQQHTQLKNIAEQCPLKGGTAVYQARTLLSTITGITGEYSENCPAYSPRASTTNKNAEELNSEVYKLYPNPNNGNIELNCILQQGDNGVLSVTDITGKEVISYSLTNSINRFFIDESFLKNGIYLYKIIINDKILKSDKLLIIR